MVYADASKEIIYKTKRILALLPLPFPLLLLIQPKPYAVSAAATTNCRHTLPYFKHCCVNFTYKQNSFQSNPGVLPLDRRRQVWTPQRKDSTGARRLSRSFWQPHKIVKAITITLLAAVAAIKRPSRCIAVA